MLALLAAFVFQTVLGRYLPFFGGYLDLFAVVAAGFGLVRGRMAGLVSGASAGLLQDAFSGGLLGFNGISKTTVGYLAGIAGRHLIIRGWSTRILFFAVATLLDLAILAVWDMPRSFRGWWARGSRHFISVSETPSLVFFW